MLHVLTPPDPNLGARAMAPLGDHAAQTGYRTPNTLALGFADAAPELQRPGLDGAGDRLERAAGGAPRPAAPDDRIVQGLAGVFRHEDSAGESLVILRAGASWGTHNTTSSRSTTTAPASP